MPEVVNTATHDIECISAIVQKYWARMLRPCPTKKACRSRPNMRREAVETTALRSFLCARCRNQVVICRRCDRGQIYCGKACAHAARRANQREAGQRYQSSDRGRANHAERSRRYRARKKNVTHRGCLAQPILLPAASALPREGSPSPAAATRTITQCHWCESCPSQFVRFNFLRRRRVFRKLNHHQTASGHGRPP